MLVLSVCRCCCVWLISWLSCCLCLVLLSVCVVLVVVWVSLSVVSLRGCWIVLVEVV